ncbi:MAG: hypothetical protein HY343_09090 [Lentisphaerae bacterium]|nr:hypothetical protein [Lentisphaerota bacterium]
MRDVGPSQWDSRSRLIAPALAVGAILMLISGCTTAQRGRDFGFWAQSGEPMNLIRFMPAQARPTIKATDSIALLPLLGAMPQSNLAALNKSLLAEARFYFQCSVAEVDRDGKMAEYLTPSNLMPMNGLFNVQEAARIGRLIGATHVLCGRIQQARLDPPQRLQLHFTLVETASMKSLVDMVAQYDAGEQNVAIELDRYLRLRSSRKYDQGSLEIVLRSPSEYGAFVAVQCMRALSERLWGGKGLKKIVTPADQ